ncbi:hypothetical protein McpAg1_13130 [Methanocorpusculaceae archaeon Ag1]|uniref:Uncharacterized protein n=1 Tax=Methanorbis furvi TaxID=3028299 RepID=A0AAE4ME50_9EURY|nr:hypothetical protein [Methanocorpusculaceae archaeon Ag1]
MNVVSCKKNRHGFTQMFNLPIAVILRSVGTPANRLRPFRPHWITAGKFFRFFVGVVSVVFLIVLTHIFFRKYNMCESVIDFSPNKATCTTQQKTEKICQSLSSEVEKDGGD